MSIEDEAKPSERPRKKQPPKPKTASEIKHSDELETHLTELVSMLRGANLPAIFDRQAKLESQIEALIKVSEDRSRAEKLRAESDENRFKKLESDHLELISHVKLISEIVPKIEGFSGSFAEIDTSVKALDKKVHLVSDRVVELKTFAEGQQLNLFSLVESAASVMTSISAIGTGVERLAAMNGELDEKLVSGHSAIKQQLDLFAESQQSITGSIDDLKLSVEPLATRQDVALSTEKGRRQTRRTIKAMGVLGQHELQRVTTEQRKHHVAITRQSLKAVDKFVKATAQRVTKETVELTDATKELTASVAESTVEIQESKTILKTGAGAIVTAQRALLEIGPFVENQIMSSMNLVVTTVAPQVSNLFKSLIDSSDLKSIPALANQFELMLDETSQNIESIRNVGDLIVSSNNYSATANRELVNHIGSMRSVAEDLSGRLGGEELLEVSKKIQGLSKGFANELEIYKGSIEGVFSNLTNVLANRLGGELEAFVAKNRISQEELYTIAEVIGNHLLVAVFEDARKDA